MRRLLTVRRNGMGLAAGALLFAGVLMAQPQASKSEPVKPPWQRYLQGEDTGKAAELEKKLSRLQSAGELTEALEVAQALEALRARAQGADHWQTADARFGVEALRRLLRQDEQGRKDYDSSLVLERQAEELEGKGRYAQASPLRKKILAIRRQVLGEDHPHTAVACNNLGANQQYQGQYPQAEESYRQALAIARKALGEEHPLTCRAFANLAASQVAQGKYQQAEEGLRQALTLWRKVVGEDHSDTAATYNNLAYSLQLQGKYQQAEEGFARALAIWRKVLGEEHPNIASCYNNLAANQHNQGRDAEAEKGYKKALAIYRKTLGEEHPQTAQTTINLANTLYAQHKYAEAEQLYRRALTIFRKLLGEEHPLTAVAYHNVANTQYESGRYAAAEEGYKQALVINRKVLGEEHPHTAGSYNNLAYSQQAQGKYHEAEEGLRKALVIQRKVLGEQHPDLVLSYSNLARCLYAQGKYREAETLWQRAADAFARVRLDIAGSGLERATFSSKRSPLPNLAAVLARAGKAEQAWQRFEESLSRGTWDDLSAQLRRSRAERSRQAQLSDRIQRLNHRIERAATARSEPGQGDGREELLSQLRQAYDELAAFSEQMEQKYGPSAGQVFDRRRIQAALPADTALLGWLDLPAPAHAADVNGEHWAVLLRSSGPPVWVRLPGRGEGGTWSDADTQLPDQLRASLQSSQGRWQPLAEQLRRQRLQPLAKHLQACDDLPAVRHLVVLPSTELAGVPVEVIAEGHTVSYAPSGTLYAHLRRQPGPTGEELLVLADPVFDPPTGKDGPWPELPGTRLEAQALLRLFAGSSVAPTALLDSQAAEQQLDRLATGDQLRRYRYLHLATHGEVDDRLPLHSAVILSRDQLPDPARQLEAGLPVVDGRLSAEEVLRQWHLDSDLVTLSACQTALGKYERGEGFVGFAQALILAGSRSVCLSLWKVDDTATTLLMERFYQNLLGKREGLKGPLGKAQALAEAKEWLRGLSGEEIRKRAARLSEGVTRGKGRKVQPLLVGGGRPEGREGPERPFGHPYYWAAFVLIGQGE